MHITSDKIAEVIILARELDRAEPEFDAFIQRLNMDEQAALVAVFWLGRGSFDDYAEAFQTAQTEASAPTESYLKGSPHLADHLEAGLELMGISAAKAEDDLIPPV